MKSLISTAQHLLLIATCMATTAAATSSFALEISGDAKRSPMRSNISLGVLLHQANVLDQEVALDHNRPTWHLTPAVGSWWDVNGLLYHKGRYHVMFIKHIYDVQGKPLTDNWGHASSTDLLHWQLHPDVLHPGLFDEGKGRPFWSGDAIENAPVPTIIPLVVRNGSKSGVWAAQPKDDELLEWSFIQQKPVLSQKPKPVPPALYIPSEYIVFDSTAWYDAAKQAYFLLCGNKNLRPGYEGDCTSLFTSKDLRAWAYLGPLYKSRRDMTSIHEDTACPDFFPLGDKWVLLSHVHNPWTHCRYYVGSFEGATFTPENMGRIGFISDQIAAPETMPDNQGRRIFFGQVRTAGKTGLWKTSFSMPVVLSLGEDKTLRFRPAEELQTLRYQTRTGKDLALDSQTRPLPEAAARSVELRATFTDITAKAVGFRVACSPEQDEFTDITYLPGEKVIEINFAKSDLGNRTRYTRYHPRALAEKMINANPDVFVQRMPFELKPGEPLDLHIFVDGCILEVIANSRAYTAQTIYPSKRQSIQAYLLTREGKARVPTLETHRLSSTLNQ
jgi:beta-fructofuranosidase